MNKNIFIQLAALALASTAFAGNGHIGSGDDGSLFATPGAIPVVSKSSDTVVAPPRFARGRLTVTYPFMDSLKLTEDAAFAESFRVSEGKEWSNTWSALPCATAGDGSPLRLGCDYWSNGQHNAYTAGVNQTLELAPGYYLVRFRGIPQPNLVQVKAGATVEIKLAKLEVPVTGQRFTFTVFQDLSDPAMLRNFLTEEWLSDGFLSGNISFCKNDDRSWVKRRDADARMKAACAAWNLNDPVAMNGTIYRMLPNGYYEDRSMIFNSSFNTFRKEVATDYEPGRAVLVFPGTYGIEFKTDLGETSSQLGVRVDAE